MLAHCSKLHLGRTAVAVASEAKQSTETSAPSGILDRRVAALLAMTIPAERSAF
jgi:hypothetical protein